MADKQEALDDIDRVTKFDPGTRDEVHDFITRRTMLVACAKRWSPPGSEYERATLATIATFDDDNASPVRDLHAVLHALHADISAGQLSTFGQRVRAEVFSDLLSQAVYLNGEGFQRAACVLAGAVLEDHIKRLAQLHALPILGPSGEPRKASVLNDELQSKAGVYGKAEQAQVSSWQKSRNDAAHGEATFEARHDKYAVHRIIDGIRWFTGKYPV